MTIDELLEVIREAERFISKAQELINVRTEHGKKYPTYRHSNFPKEQGSVKRASMDLTRSLAELRKSK